MQTEVKDPIATPGPPERVHYEIGTLLGAEDFRDEQSYHRGRLALALSALHGGGTIAGLKVTRVPAAPNRPRRSTAMKLMLRSKPLGSIRAIRRMVSMQAS